MVLLALAVSVPTPQPPTVVDVDAQARAEGNRRADAVAIGRVLLARTWPAQVLKIRVDGVGSHAIAGLMLSGVKFHGALDDRRFLTEVASLVDRVFATSHVEEVDVWAVVPISVQKGEIVAGDYAKPTNRVVFSATLRRADAGEGAMRALRKSDNLFWDESWRASLHG